MDKMALMSTCRSWRYVLWRIWAEGRVLAVIGLNPSTANETNDDPTIRRCIGFAERLGYDGLVMLNLFSYRATDPEEMMAAEDPVGPRTKNTFEHVFTDMFSEVPAVLCAWGAKGTHMNQDIEVMSWLTDWHVVPMCLGITENGSPKHPLYLSYDTNPVWYEGRDSWTIKNKTS